MKTTKTKSALLSLLCLVIGLTILFPLFFAFSASFLTPAEMAVFPPKLFTFTPIFTNYQDVFNSVPMLAFLINSFIVCAIVIMAQIITASLSAYAFAFFNFRGKNILFTAILSTMMIPGESIIVANFLTISSLRLVDSYVALVLPFLTTAMTIFLVRQFYLTIPKEIKEASLIDSCSDMQFLFKILIPLSKPIIATLCIYSFINTYNMYLWPLLVTNSPSKRTIQIGMGMLRTSEQVNYPIIMAGAVVSLLPAIAVFIFGNRLLVRGMMEGSIKG